MPLGPGAAASRLQDRQTDTFTQSFSLGKLNLNLKTNTQTDRTARHSDCKRHRPTLSWGHSSGLPTGSPRTEMT